MLNHYLVNSLRSFRKHTVVSIIQVIGLSVGLACFIVGLGAVRYWSTSDRQFVNSERTYVVTQAVTYRGTARAGAGPSAAYHVAKYIRNDIPELDAVARAVNWSSLPVTVADTTMPLKIAGADPAFVKIFRLPLQSVAPDALRSPRSALLTSDAARRLFGTTSIVGRSLRLNKDIDLTVTGLFDPPTPSHLGTDGYIKFELLVSWDVIDTLIKATDPAIADSSNEIWFALCCTTYVQLPADGSLTLAMLRDRLKQIGQRRVPTSQNAFADITFNAVPLSDVKTTELERVLFTNSGVHISFRSALLLLATLVLGVATVNYANLASAQVLQDSGQIGVRRILGARRWALAGQIVFDCVLHFIVALALALAMVSASATVVRNYLGVDVGTVLASATFLASLIGAALSAILVASIYPALVTLAIRPQAVLRSTRGRASAGWNSQLLVAIQFCIASVLVTTVIVIHQQSNELRQVLTDHSSRVVAIANNLETTKVDFDTLKTELLRDPSIQGVSASAAMPWEFRSFRTPLSRLPVAAATVINTSGDMVWHDYFATMGTPVIAGRVFSAAYDDISNSMMSDTARPNSMVIDRSLSDQLGFSSPQAAVNQLLYVQNPFASTPQSVRVIGVVESRPVHLVGVGTSSNAFTLHPAAKRFALIRIDGDLSAALSTIDRTWQRLAPQVPLRRQFTDELFAAHYEIFNRIDHTFQLLAALALSVSALGLIGMAMHVIAGRLHEVGVRKTLGASAGRILTVLLGDFSKPVLVANLMAIPFALLISRTYLDVFVQRVALTPMPFIFSMFVTVMIAWMAVGMQSIKAARTNPASVLRHE